MLEQATQGLPGRWQICIAENEEESPWEPFAENGGVAGGVSAVSATLTRTMEFVDNRHTPNHEDVLRDLQDTIGRIGSQIFPQTVGRARAVPRARADVRRGGHVQGRRAELAASSAAAAPAPSCRRWARPRSRRKTFHGPYEGDEAFHTFLAGPTAIPVIVAGAKNAAISMVVRIFGEWSGTAVPVGEKK